MRIHDLYGANGPTLESATNRISAALDVLFEMHESSYRGGLYYLHESQALGSVSVINNASTEDPDDQPYLEYADYGVVISVEEPAAADTLARLLEANGFIHLHREEY